MTRLSLPVQSFICDRQGLSAPWTHIESYRDMGMAADYIDTLHSNLNEKEAQNQNKLYCVSQLSVHYLKGTSAVQCRRIVE